MMRAKKYPRGTSRRGLFLWVLGAASAFLLVQLVFTLVEELPRLIEELK